MFKEVKKKRKKKKYKRNRTTPAEKKHQMINRQRKVKMMRFVKKWTIHDIAAELNVNDKTIQRDLEEIVKHCKKLTDKNLQKDLSQLLFETIETYEYRVKCLWDKYKEDLDPEIIIKIMKELREQESQHNEFLQSLGVLYKEPEKFDVTETAKTEINISEKTLAAIGKAIIRAKAKDSKVGA